MQGMQSPGWADQVLRALGGIQGCQQLAQALGMHDLDARHAPSPEKHFKPLVPERENHKLLSLDLQIVGAAIGRSCDGAQLARFSRRIERNASLLKNPRLDAFMVNPQQV